MPLKPAKEATVLRFGKHGKVARDVREWPRIKEKQEASAAGLFAVLLEEWTGRRLTGLRPLPEGDQDVEAREGSTRVEIQVTELVTREYILEELGAGVLRMDMDGLKSALAGRIKAKVARHYVKPAGVRLILLIYSADPGAHEFLGTNVTQPDGTSALLVPEGLLRAQQVAPETPGPFDEIWYVVPTAGSRPGFLAGVLPAES
jgi:hypothetical protein